MADGGGSPPPPLRSRTTGESVAPRPDAKIDQDWRCNEHRGVDYPASTTPNIMVAVKLSIAWPPEQQQREQGKRHCYGE